MQKQTSEQSNVIRIVATQHNIVTCKDCN